jgi:hypothetical protein
MLAILPTMPYSIGLVPYLITLSARARTLGGLVSPIRLAALRLMMNSNFFGCSTGSSVSYDDSRYLLLAKARANTKNINCRKHDNTYLNPARASIDTVREKNS